MSARAQQPSRLAGETGFEAVPDDVLGRQVVQIGQHLIARAAGATWSPAHGLYVDPLLEVVRRLTCGALPASGLLERAGGAPVVSPLGPRLRGDERRGS